MKTARPLLEDFTASSFRDTKRASEMFAENGAFEMPYLESLGFQWRYEGREEIEGFLKFVRELYPDMDFHDVKILCETSDVVVGEYEFTTKSSKTGRMIHQLFVGQLESENGKIKLLRESINLVELGSRHFSQRFGRLQCARRTSKRSIGVSPRACREMRCEKRNLRS